MKKIYFFNGWAMDKNILNAVKNSSEYIIDVINFPYDLNIEDIKQADEPIFVAWSFGVYYLNKFLLENKNLKYKKTIAINGLPQTIGQYGINPKMFDMTVRTLSPENLLKFYENMDIDKSFVKADKDFEYIKNELEFFRENYELMKEDYIDFYYIGKYDRIIPRAKQEKFCQERKKKYELIDCGHYPFSYFKDFKDIICLNGENEE